MLGLLSFDYVEEKGDRRERCLTSRRRQSKREPRQMGERAWQCCRFANIKSLF